MNTYSWKGFALDLLIGFAALLIGLLPGALIAHFVPSTGLLFGLCGAVFFLIAYLRARPYANPLLQGLGIGIGAGLPVLLLLVLMFSAFVLLGITVFVVFLIVCVAGAVSRRLISAKQFPVAAAVIVVIAALGFVDWHILVPRLVTEALVQTVDKPSPNFTLTRLDGTPVTLASLHGKVVVLDFWATWCAPCQAEMPTLLKVYRQFQNDPNVVYIAVATGWDDDSADKVRTFITRKHFPFPVAFDSSHATKQFSITTIPTQILIDRNGHIRMIDTGYHDNDAELLSTLTDGIQRLLK